MADLADHAADAEQLMREDAIAAHFRAREIGTGTLECTDCGCRIPAERRRLVPHADRCTECQAAHEQQQRRR